MRVALGLVFVCATAFPLPSLAGERAPGTVAVGSRVFLAPGQPDRQPTGLPPADAPWMRVAVHLDEMDWLWEVLDADPLLGSYVPQIEILRGTEPPSILFSDDAVMESFGNRESVPDELRLEGYDAQTRSLKGPPREFNFRPDGAAPDYMMRCANYASVPEGGIFEYCSLTASYPVDPSITLVASLFRAPFPELALDAPTIVDRLREIALCLDVTDAPPADPEAALAALLAENPTLSGCEGRLTS